MRRKSLLVLLFSVVLLIAAAGGVFAKEVLAILPFTGGSGDEGAAIAERFSFRSEIRAYFDPVLRTDMKDAIAFEQHIQGSGLTKDDDWAAIAKQTGAQYVLSGSISKVGNRNLLIITLYHLKETRLVSGAWTTYYRLENVIDNDLPTMAKAVVRDAQMNASGLTKVAVAPVVIDGADENTAIVLSQILSIELLRKGKHALYPRDNQTIEKIKAEIKNQFENNDERYLPDVGKGDNPHFVLSVIARTVRSRNMFNAAIINMVTGISVETASVDYKNLEDGINVMGTIAQDLVSTPEEAERQKLEERRLAAEQENQRREMQRLEAQLAEEQKQKEQRRQEELEIQRRAAQRKEEQRDKFLRNTGIGFGIRAGLGLGFYNGTSHYTHYRNGDDDYSYDNVGFDIPVAVSLELKLHPYFSIQPEFSAHFLLADPFSIPVLAKINLSAGFSPFFGIAFNLVNEKDHKDIGIMGKGEEIVSMPLSGVLGFEWDKKLDDITLFLDLRYTFDFSDREAVSGDDDYGYKNTYKQSFIDISFGIKYTIPFRR